MQILNGGHLAIAHYTVYETYKWIGEDKTDNEGKTVQKDQELNGKLRFSDIYIKADDQWLYLGGHRDGAYLKSNN